MPPHPYTHGVPYTLQVDTLDNTDPIVERINAQEQNPNSLTLTI